MRIKLQMIQNFVCLPLPPSLTAERGFQAGDEVEIVPDPERGQIIVRRADAAASAIAATPDFSGALEEFLARHAQAMAELAAL
jgi:bifunctional DNA-binding transcriptional regulator/antitoxin component of YhaV-PrlF toxin-antitoxin module